MPDPAQEISAEDSACIERVLTVVFPDDVATIGTKRLHDIARDPKKPVADAYRPEVGGEQADIVALLDLLRDGALITYYSILISNELRKSDPKGNSPKPDEVKKEINKQVDEGKLRVSARVLKYADKI